jgi:NAD(P)-dependent dehydrogenase (short-subunit alcohol dehydrogenase family)
VEQTAVDLFGLTGRTAVVTGGSRGIGLMIARGLLQTGATVVLSSRRADASRRPGPTCWPAAARRIAS